jgi:hypothetical protein
MYIFDLEGTLTDCDHRIHHYENKDWDAWNKSIVLDTPRLGIIKLLKVCRATANAFILTSKEERYKKLVDYWLEINNLGDLSDFIFYKNDKFKNMSSPFYKLNSIKELMCRYGNPLMVFDDREDVVLHLIKNNIPAIKV